MVSECHWWSDEREIMRAWLPTRVVASKSNPVLLRLQEPGSKRQRSTVLRNVQVATQVQDLDRATRGLVLVNAEERPLEVVVLERVHLVA